MLNDIITIIIIIIISFNYYSSVLYLVKGKLIW